MNPALQREHSDLKPGGHKINRPQPFLLQLGNPGDLGVDVAVTDSVLARPLILLSRPRKCELGQIQKVGAVVGRLDIKEGRLPILQDWMISGDLYPCLPLETRQLPQSVMAVS